MSAAAWIVIALVVIVLGYFGVMRVFYRQSRELDKKIDLGKMRKWKDDDE